MEPIYFATPAEFRAWLEANHETETELLVGFHKKATGVPSMTWPEAVDEALCFGWIDGVRKKTAPESYTNRFTPRKAGSIWSNVNLGHVERLIAAGKMHPAGLAAFQARTAAKTGVYSFERKQPASLPAAFAKKFRAAKRAWAFFSAQPPGYRRLALHFVLSAKQEVTRLRRLERLLADSTAGRRLGVLG